MEKLIKGKLVVITGGVDGIGYEIANHFLKKEAKLIIILDIQDTKGIEAQEKLNNHHGTSKALFMKCDVTRDLDKISQIIFDKYGSVDILINNAGIFAEISIEKSVAVNITALMNFTYKFWDHMRRDKGGKGGTIINISSIYGFRIFPFLPIYQGTKFAVLGFSKSLGHSYNYKMSKVRVLTICPGLTFTAMTKNAISREPELTQEDFQKECGNHEWQEAEALGKGAVEVFERAESGTAWLIEGGRAPVEVL